MLVRNLFLLENKLKPGFTEMKSTTTREYVHLGITEIKSTPIEKMLKPSFTGIKFTTTKEYVKAGIYWNEMSFH